MSQPPDAGVRDVIRGLDLSAIVEAARQAHHWGKPEAERNEGRYRDFLWVCWNGMQGLQPKVAAFSRSADEVWHQHILWTAKYRQDCESVFGKGRFLDHVPIYAADVKPGDIEAAMKVYRDLGLEVPPDVIMECVWAIVT